MFVWVCVFACVFYAYIVTHTHIYIYMYVYNTDTFRLAYMNVLVCTFTCVCVCVCASLCVGGLCDVFTVHGICLYTWVGVIRGNTLCLLQQSLLFKKTFIWILR